MSFSRLGRGLALATSLFALNAQSASAFETDESPRDVRQYWTPERVETGDALLRDAAAVVPIGDLDLGLGPAETQRAHAQPVGNPNTKPFRTHGKVFFTLGGLDYV